MHFPITTSLIWVDIVFFWMIVDVHLWLHNNIFHIKKKSLGGAFVHQQHVCGLLQLNRQHFFIILLKYFWLKILTSCDVLD